MVFITSEKGSRKVYKEGFEGKSWSWWNFSYLYNVGKFLKSMIKIKLLFSITLFFSIIQEFVLKGWVFLLTKPL